MRRILTHLAGLGLLLGVAVLLSGFGQAADDFKPEEGFTSLFNGKDLTGWRYKGSKESLEGKTETADGRIKVENGAIVMMEKDSKGKGGIRDLYTVHNFDKPFHLKLEFRAAAKADSGVYVRGPQLQVRDFIRRNEQKHLKKFKNDDWNELDIVVQNVEGKIVAVCTCNGERLATMRNIPAKGGIGLQAETGKFEFRRLRVKEME